jgi:hypothetical protein
MKTTTQIFAGLLIVIGLLLVGIPTGAVDQIDAERGVSVDVATEETAYLAVTDTYIEGNTVRNCRFTFFGDGCTTIFAFDISREAAELENRFVETFTTVQVEVESVEHAPDDTLELREVPTQLSPDDEGLPFNLGCSGESNVENQGNVILGLHVSGDNIVVNTTTRIENVDYRCST